MTRWTTDPQEEWLRMKVQAYCEAKASKATNAFYTNVYREWHNQWPVPEPSAEAVAKAQGSRDVAEKELRGKSERRVRQWFYNHSNSPKATLRDLAKSTKPLLASSILKVQGQPKLLQEWQAYHSMTYTTQWKDIVAENFKKIERDWKAANPGKKMTMTRFEYMTKFMKEKYDQVIADPETGEKVKAEVEEYRQDMKAKATKGVNTHSYNARQIVIDKLPKLLMDIAESLKLQTGWDVSILAGGPMPRENGAIRSIFYHAGKTPSDKTLAGYDEERYQDTVDFFDDFLHEAFPEDVRANIKMSNSDDVDDSDSDEESTSVRTEEKDTSDNERKTSEEMKTQGQKKKGKATVDGSEGEQVDQDQTAGQDVEINEQIDVNVGSKDGNERNGESDKPKALTYLEERERNIKRNEQLLESLGIKTAMKAVRSSTSTSDKKGKRRARSTPPPPTRRRSGRNSAPNATTNNSLPPLSAVSAQSDPGTLSVVQLEVFESHAGGAWSANQEKVKEIENVEGREGHSGQGCSRDEGGATGGGNEELRGNHEGVGQGTLMDVDGDSPVDDNNGNVQIGNNGDPITSPTLVPTGSSPPSQPSDLSALNANSSCSLPKVPPALPATSPLVVNESAFRKCPNWLDPLLGHLRATSSAPEWQRLIATFIAFENVEPPKKQLSAATRPEAVGIWIKRHKNKKTDPLPVDPSEYVIKFNAWWISLQPSWRQALDANGHLIRSMPPGETWTSLAKGGNTGVFLVLLALSFWIRSLDSTVTMDHAVWDAVDDVYWVITQLISLYSKAKVTGKKRAAEEDAGPSKKRRKA